MKVPFYQNGLFCDTRVVEELEKEFAHYVGFKYGVAVDSCTNAIGLCLEYETPGVVGIPAMTYVSVANEILRRKIKLELVDKYCVGESYQLEGTNIWDSAHEVTPFNSKTPETKRCYSFYPTKLVPSYEGGMICTDDKDFVDWARFARQMGRTGYGAEYDVVYPGMKCNITPMQAITALQSFKVLEKIKDKHRAISGIYAMEGFPSIVKSDHLHIIKVKNNKKCRDFMRDKGIECSWHFQPLYEKTFYKDKFKAEDYPESERLKEQILSLPMFPAMTSEQQVYVVDCLKEYHASN